MKIILVNRYFHPDRSPTSLLLSDLAFHLAALGKEVHVVTSRMRADEAGAVLLPYEEIDGVHIHRMWTSRFGKRWLPGRALDYLTFHLATERRLLAMVEKGDRVVAKSDPPMLATLVNGIAHRRNAVQINWLHEIFPEAAAAQGVHGLKGRVGAHLRGMATRTINNAFMTVVPGDSMRRSLVEGRGIPTARVRVIRDWFDGEGVAPVSGDDDNPLREEWGLRGKFIVGHIGNFDRVSEYETFLNAADRLRGEREIRFLFVGGGSKMSALKKDARKRNLANLVFQPDQQGERLRQSMALPDIHLVSMRESVEGLMLPERFYQVAAAGKPLIYVGRKEGEVANWIHLAKMGTTVGEGDGAKLARRILVMRLAPERLAKMGDNANRLYRARFAPGRALKKWVELLGVDDPAFFVDNGESGSSSNGLDDPD